MLARTVSAALVGLDPVKIEIEVDTTPGIPSLVVIGLATKEIDEAKERITSSLQHCGIPIRSQRIVVNLAPADLRKSGSAFELAIAAALIQCYGSYDLDLQDTLLFGELSLDGSIKPIKGALPLLLSARRLGYSKVIIPTGNAQEVSVIKDIEIYAFDTLHHFLHSVSTKKLDTIQSTTFQPQLSSGGVDFADIVDQQLAKKSLEIAAAGNHNTLLLGPPGTGKSMLAKSFSGILPPLTLEEAIEVTCLHSIAGLTTKSGLVRTRPFRNPHHTASTTGLTGGGSPPIPGEISLAHRGVLFLDELTEFSRFSIDALRQPLEDKTITITRVGHNVCYPANFTLLAASNPCPCGYRHSTQKPCKCTPPKLRQYFSKISGPVIDRFDMTIWAGEVSAVSLTSTYKVPAESSAVVRERVISARAVQRHRYSGTDILTNADLPSCAVQEYCPLHLHARRVLLRASAQRHLSARGVIRVIKVARTIADIAQSDLIHVEHVSKALELRTTLV